MRCSKCGAENPDGAKFCIECASPLARRCSSCGKENPPRAKFCLECSKPIDPPPAESPDTRETLKSSVRISTVADGAQLEGERKTVTALFADIKGSTELEQDLDPEEARAIVDPALKLMIDAVRRYDGYVVQSTGDGVFAMFGAPVAHEELVRSETASPEHLDSLLSSASHNARNNPPNPVSPDGKRIALPLCERRIAG